jgi:hypothetical protein
MELYSGAKIVDDKYEKTNIARSIDREFTVIEYMTQHWGEFGVIFLSVSFEINRVMVLSYSGLVSDST